MFAHAPARRHRSLPSTPTAPARRVGLSLVAVTLATLTAACGGGSDDAGESVTVYTGRHYGIEGVFDEFTAATGIDVRFTTGSDPELRERLLAEGDNTPADLVMTADAANIELASEAGLLASVESETLTSAIPSELRSADNTWFALSRRLRVIMYSTERVSDPPITYAALGDSRWSGKLCLRPSTHPYTQSLVASLILNLGDDEALRVVESWVANDPLYINSDTDILKAIAAGDCDVALTNTYYLPRLLADDPAFPVAISWPDQDSTGAHLNVSAAGVTKSAPNREAAIRLLEWLATTGQSTFSEANFEYPADPGVTPASALTALGEFVADLAAVRELGRLNPRAVEVLSAAGYE